ncbi:MAG: response regulator, partial [Gammaproteobacteria bacterium]
DTAETLRMLLEANGAEVRVATTGPQALAAYARFEPDVVLLDIGLPGMSGYEVARRLRAEFPTRATMLVALTGWGRQEDVSRARDVGFDDHLVKPVDLAALRRLLASSKRSASDNSPRTERPVP